MFRDHLGGTSVIVNGGGSPLWKDLYAPYGDLRYHWDSTPSYAQTQYRYTGQRFEPDLAGGLYDYVARFYDPALGRFAQPDTIVPNPGNPSDLNRYVYTRNNPIGFNDPTGHRLEEGAGYQVCGGIGCTYPEDHPLAGYLIGTTEEDVAQAQAQMQAAGEVVIGILWEPADWAITFNYWRQGEFHWTDLIGLAPGIPVAAVRAARHVGRALSFIDPKLVRYTQSSASEYFKDGRSVMDMAESLRKGALTPESVPPIRVYEADGMLWSLDNRRLAAFELAEVDIPYIWATAEEAAKGAWKVTTRNEGISIRIRGANIIVGGG